jgi:hypothetical protein
MTSEELAQCHILLGVMPGVTAAELERAFMKKNFALLKGKGGAADQAQPALEAERARLRAAYELLSAHVREQELASAEPRKKPALIPAHAPRPPMTLLTPPALNPRNPEDDEFFLLRFDDWKVNTFVPPLLLAVTWLITVSPAGFFLRGFQVWMHEFGHAVPAWLCGFRATPLPFGWTPVEPEYSHFVYWGLLLMFGILFAAGLKERKVWAMIAAVGAAVLQYYMTWRMPDHRQEFWWSAFGGVGGEFVLSTLLMMFFWVQLPEKFRWGGCRYVFFFIGATAFTAIWSRWGDVYRGIEEIPFGSMINGEEDQGGDMNKLMDGYGWKKADIRRNYYVLGKWCWGALGVTWLVFALRLNRAADWVVGKLAKQEG